MFGWSYDENFKEQQDENFLQVVSRMSCAIIMQIAKDISTEPQVENGSYYAKKRNKQLEKTKIEAIEWVKSNENSFFSINSCCNHINNYMYSIGKCLPLLTPEYLKNMLLNNPKKFLEDSAGMQEILLMNINDSSDNDYFGIAINQSGASRHGSEVCSKMCI